MLDSVRDVLNLISSIMINEATLAESIRRLRQGDVPRSPRP